MKKAIPRIVFINTSPFKVGRELAPAYREHQPDSDPFVSAGQDHDAAVLLGAVLEELRQARENWPVYNSAHEAQMVLEEEVHELRAHVFTNQKKRDILAMKKECIQVAAVALRYCLDICNEQRGRR